MPFLMHNVRPKTVIRGGRWTIARSLFLQTLPASRCKWKSKVSEIFLCLHFTRHKKQKPGPFLIHNEMKHKNQKIQFQTTYLGVVTVFAFIDFHFMIYLRQGVRFQ